MVWFNPLNLNNEIQFSELGNIVSGSQYYETGKDEDHNLNMP